MSQPNIVKVCNKYDILLTKNKDTDVFTIKFSMINNKVDISKLMSFSIYDLIKDLNSDLLDRLEIKKKHSENECDVLFCFSKLGKELGISNKYMFIKSKITREDQRITFYSNSIPYLDNDIGKKYSKITNEFSDLYVDILPDNEVQINYVFKIDMHEPLPIYMENMIGLMMKKMFYRLKVFIENVD